MCGTYTSRQAYAGELVRECVISPRPRSDLCQKRGRESLDSDWWGLEVRRRRYLKESLRGSQTNVQPLTTGMVLAVSGLAIGDLPFVGKAKSSPVSTPQPVSSGSTARSSRLTLESGSNGFQGHGIAIAPVTNVVYVTLRDTTTVTRLLFPRSDDYTHIGCSGHHFLASGLPILLRCHDIVVLVEMISMGSAHVEPPRNCEAGLL